MRAYTFKARQISTTAKKISGMLLRVDNRKRTTKGEMYRDKKSWQKGGNLHETSVVQTARTLSHSR